MYRLINRIIIYFTFTWLVLSVYMAFSGAGIALYINRWQMMWLGESRFYPVLTMGVLFIPPMIVVLPLKFLVNKKLKSIK